MTNLVEKLDGSSAQEVVIHLHEEGEGWPR